MGVKLNPVRDDEDDDGPGPELDGLAADEAWDLPAESRGVLLESLASEDRGVRLEALETLAHSLDDGLAAIALDLAKSDPDEEVRCAAAVALGPALAASFQWEHGDGAPGPLSPTTVSAMRLGLRHLYFDSASPSEVRRRALEAAVQSPEPWQEGAARAAWASHDPAWRTTAVACMARLPGFAAELLEALRDREPHVRLEAARAAGDGEIHEAAGRLLNLARAADEDPLVRMAAMESLGLLGDRRSRAPLLELAGSADPELAYAARSALARIASQNVGYESGDGDV